VKQESSQESGKERWLIIDELLHAINDAASFQIACKGSPIHEEIIFRLASYDFKANLLPTIRELNESKIEGPSRLEELYRKVTGEEFDGRV